MGVGVWMDVHTHTHTHTHNTHTHTATAALKPYLERLSAAKKLVEEAEAAAANVGGLPRTKEGKIDYSKALDYTYTYTHTLSLSHTHTHTTTHTTYIIDSIYIHTHTIYN